MKAGKIGNQKKNHDYLYYNIIKIGQNTKNSPGV